MNQPQISIPQQPLNETEIQDWLAVHIAEQLGVDEAEIELDVPFDSFGLDSVQTMSIANLGKEQLGLQLSPLVIWNYPNIESLSRYIARELAASDLEVFEL
ncbi:MAG: acyl carrier protein [Cyanobacteria bacterium P01_A01_bin.83]